ncbi:MAG: hypothetical protein V4772_15795 [Pseudomonadota bacterium]
MKILPKPQTKLSKNARRWSVACGAYVLMVSASIAAAATLVSESVPFIVAGL